MDIYSQFKRCVRIRAVLNKKHGRDVVIEDAETGEAISNIFKVVITLIPNELVFAEFTYYEADGETGQLIQGSDGGPVEKQITSSNIEIDLTALERWQKEKQLRKEEDL
jgi:hypothetical protein